jgi:hypothetical protein
MWVRLGLVIVLALVVRQAVLHYGRKAMDRRSNSAPKNRRRRQ